MPSSSILSIYLGLLIIVTSPSSISSAIACWTRSPRDISKALDMIINSDSLLLDKSSYLPILVDSMPNASAITLFVTP